MGNVLDAQETGSSGYACEKRNASVSCQLKSRVHLRQAQFRAGRQFQNVPNLLTVIMTLSTRQ
jgi:hypothetical protein